MGICFKVKKENTDNLGIFSEKGFDTCIIFWVGANTWVIKGNVGDRNTFIELKNCCLPS